MRRRGKHGGMRHQIPTIKETHGYRGDMEFGAEELTVIKEKQERMR